MRVLITTQHLHPLVPVAQALIAAGHEVAFACPADNRPALDAIGIRHLPAGVGMGELMPTLMPQLMATPEAERETWVMRHAFGHLLPARMIPDLLAIVRDWQPHAIVRDSIEFGGAITAERLGLPHASVEVGAFIPAAWAAQMMGNALNDLRAGAGLPADPALDMLYRYLHLSFVPPGYQDPNRPLPPTAHALRTIVFDRSGAEELPAWVATLPDLPVVYATLGLAIFNRTPGLFAAVIDALRDEPLTLIVTIGREQDPEMFGPLPANVHVERYIPQSLLLPRVNAVVCHGGWNTVMAALAHGLPIVAIPIGADQPFNAARVAALQLGQALGPNQRTPAAIRSAVRALLDDDRYRRNAETLREEMESLPGPAHAVDLLERLVRDHQPLMRGS